MAIWYNKLKAKGVFGLTFREAVSKLNDAGIDAARHDAAVLAERLCGIDRARLPLMYDEELQSPAFDEAVEKRASRIPLQYIIGGWEFFGLWFELDESCLCPRPDTEITVEKALELLPKNGRFLELCTGSGCISVSICKTRGDLLGIATDKFEATAKMARKNSERQEVSDRLSVIRADLFDSPDYIGGEKFDAVISNPPYIPTRDIDGLSAEVKKEPIAALDGGEDGLDFYRYIVGEYARYLRPDGIMIFEIGYDQGEALKNIAESRGYGCEIFKDLENNDRVAVINVKG